MAKLREIMTSDVYIVDEDTPTTDVAQALVSKRMGSALVMNGAVLSGIITERDILRAAASGADLTMTPASKWMTPDPETAEPDLDSEDAADIMLTQGFRHLPVLDGSKVAGIVSLRDVLSARIRRS